MSGKAGGIPAALAGPENVPERQDCRSPRRARQAPALHVSDARHRDCRCEGLRHDSALRRATRHRLGAVGNVQRPAPRWRARLCPCKRSRCRTTQPEPVRLGAGGINTLGESNPRFRTKNPNEGSANASTHKNLHEAASPPSVESTVPDDHPDAPDAELPMIANVWPRLPAPVRAAVLTLIEPFVDTP